MGEALWERRKGEKWGSHFATKETSNHVAAMHGGTSIISAEKTEVEKRMRHPIGNK